MNTKTNKKEILIVLNQFFKGGAETSLLNFFKYLPKEKYNIDFILLNDQEVDGIVSLVKEIPYNINLINVAKNNSLFKRILFKMFGYKSIVPQKKYDTAITYGEWVDPWVVAQNVNADKKMLWVHSDLDKSITFNEKTFSDIENFYDKFIFVSKSSMEKSLTRFKGLKDKSVVVHNLLDTKKILELSNEEIEEEFLKEEFILSVGNLRKEKNYERQIQAFSLIKDKLPEIKWLVIGDIDNNIYRQSLEKLIKKYDLEDRFILLGAKSNPYKYMKNAKIITALGDYESWSLVINEAIILEKTIVSTKTSGAIEQLGNDYTYLCDFTKEDIALKIENCLNNEENQMQKDINNKSVNPIEEFNNIIESWE